LKEECHIDPKSLIASPDFKSHWVEGMTDEDYHGDKTALGSSTLRIALQESNRALYWAHFLGKKRKDSVSMFRGRVIHMAVLERQKFLEKYQVMPAFTGRTKDGKESANSGEAREKRAKWLAELPPGAHVVEPDDLTMVENVATAISEDPHIMDVLKKSYVESVGYYKDKYSGLRLKIKPDFVAIDGSFIGDLKTTESSDEKTWGYRVADLRYDFQLYMQAEGICQITGIRPQRYFLIMAQNKWPFETALVNVPIVTIENCKDEYISVVKRIRDSVDTGIWPKKYGGIRQLVLPSHFIENQGMEGV
jgi:hypothetical protein